ncbi:energy transducer TonB [Stenotrophomonas sp. MMGLT7]|uniref:energy transducer TonB n=1 Tax=Stenotrophomonas sp. MMGLT7 TaxID=2901227 RepID=UPI001E44915C|nr:energy transducer TonB [Stenotrophomonas sp. MMGLT7]MCD7097594.1 energy transducer TonB [Stenotrophomonas sp. MMGLT7]
MSTPALAWACLLAAACAGCASGGRPPPREEAAYSQSIDSRLLGAESDGGGGGRLERYTLQPRQLFRMPLPLQAPEPVLPPQAGRQTLPPTVVCVSVAIADDGTVMHATPLAEREECGAVADPASAVLVQAALDAVARWRFRPAAMCSYADAAVPDDPGDCADAQQVQPVAVTLQYAFTFEVRQGKATVRSGSMPRS